MAIKKKTSVGNKKTAPSKKALAREIEAPVKTNTSNRVVAKVLVVMIVLACAWEVFQMTENQVIPQLKASLVLKIDSGTKGTGGFTAWGASEVGHDKILVADSKNNHLLLFDRKGNFLKSWGATKNKVKQFNEPSGMTPDDHGNAYVLDCWNSAVKGFNENGEIAHISLSDKGFYGPRGICFDGSNFAIADTGSHRIVFMDPKSNVVKIWGSLGSGEGHFNNPIAIACDKKGHYFVADMDNHRVQYLDSDGKKIKFVDFKGRVNAVAVDSEERVYVGTDANNGEVEVLNSNGTPLGTLTDATGSSDMFKNIKFMTVTSDDLLLMTSDDGVCLYQLPSTGTK